MAALKYFAIVTLLAGAWAQPTTNQNFDCALDDVTCIKTNIVSYVNSVFKKDLLPLTDNVEVSENGVNQRMARQEQDPDLIDQAETYLKKHDIAFKFPLGGAKVTVQSRNLDHDELDLKVKFGDDSQVEGKSKKSKLRKIIVPVLVFILLKAMTVVPLALGVLGLKAWNALQLSFFSFVISVAMAIFQLCKKIAVDNSVSAPQIAHGWESAQHYAAQRSFDGVKGVGEGQGLAYQAYL